MKRASAGLGAIVIALAAPTLAAAQNGPALRMYADTGFAGDSHRIDRTVDNLNAVRFDDRARSLIAEGRWEVCLDAAYQGGCRVVQGRVSDMGDWNARVSSVRYLGPADWGAGGEGGTGAGDMAGGSGVDGDTRHRTPDGPSFRVDYQPEVIGRIFDTDFGALTLERWDLDGVDGHYTGTASDGSDAGRIEGRIAPDPSDGGVSFAGHWYAQSAGRRCSSPRGGTHYWGSATLIFNRDRSSFQGYWDYCGAGGAPEGSWHGSLVGRDPMIEAAVNAQLGGQSVGHAPARPGQRGASSAAPVDAQGRPLPGILDRAARAAGDEAERRAHERIREGIGRLF